jgi:prephenate dehydratase
MKTVSIQGEPASYHDIATRQFFGDDVQLDCQDSFKAVFSTLKDGRADFAVIALENSLYGSINEVYDLLLKYKFWILGEVYLRIEHCLIGLPGSRMNGIKEVHSHPVALAQCEDYLDTKLAHAERFEHHDTAGSVADVKKWNDITKAAIASKAAAELYNLTVLAKNIETNNENYTRFVVLHKNRQDLDANKTSLVLQTDNSPGALYRALGAFADRNINLSKLQSRPIIGRAWKYMFYIDVEAGILDANLTEALLQLEDQGCTVVVLGSYEKSRS